MKSIRAIGFASVSGVPCLSGVNASDPRKGRPMASNARKRTTMAKLQREQRVRERREEKQAKKDLRKQTAPQREDGPDDTPSGG